MKLTVDKRFICDVLRISSQEFSQLIAEPLQPPSRSTGQQMEAEQQPSILRTYVKILTKRMQNPLVSNSINPLWRPLPLTC